MRSLLALVLSGCTLVVGSDPHVDEDAAIDAAPADDAGSPTKDDDSKDPPDAGNACDVAGCNAAKDACKKTCATVAKKCNDGCTDQDGKGCHDLCNQQQQACNAGCLTTCLQCVMGCGTCGP
jgi:hypothetical protein